MFSLLRVLVSILLIFYSLSANALQVPPITVNLSNNLLKPIVVSSTNPDGNESDLTVPPLSSKVITVFPQDLSAGANAIETLSLGDDTITLTQNIANGSFVTGSYGNGFYIPNTSQLNIRRANANFGGQDVEVAENVQNFRVNYVITPKHEDKASGEQNVLSLLSYNTWGTSVADSLRVTERFKAMPKLLSGYDVLALSELFTPKPRKNLLNALKNEYPYQTKDIHQSQRLLGAGIRILSKYPIIAEDAITYDNCAEFECFADKGAVYVQIDKNGYTYNIFLTHTQSGGDEAATKARAAQINQLADFIASKHIKYDQPIIIAGDLNIDKLSKEKQEEYQHMLLVLFAQDVNSDGFPYSYDKDTNHWAMNSHEYIDHILTVRDRLKLIDGKVEVVAPRSTNNALWGEWDLSDHYALHATLKFPKYPG